MRKRQRERDNQLQMNQSLHMNNQVHNQLHQHSTTIIDCPEHLAKVNYLALESLENMLEDQITIKAYHDSILDNKHLFAGKYVLHLTQGVNCLYSFFAAEAGSKKVYCVINGHGEREQQNIYMMRQVVSENKMGDVIQVMSWKDFNVEVDIIIGQPMGYCLHFDGMLDRIIEARDMFLHRSGLIFPNTLSLKCVGVHDEHFYDHKVQYWNQVYGIPMKSMKQWISHEPVIRVVDPTLVVTRVAKMLTFDLQTISYEDIIKIDRIFELELLGQCRSNGVSFWFEATFDHGFEKRQIKASPWLESTKFTQTTLYWPTVEYFKGGRLRVRVKGQKFPKEGYSIITTEVDNKRYQYSFS